MKAAGLLLVFLIGCGPSGESDSSDASTDAREARSDPAALAARGDALMQRYRETERFADLVSAERAYNEALRLDPKSVDARVGLAWVLSVEHEFPGAIEWAERALALDPQDARAHGVLGDAALELGDHARAEAHYQVMLDLAPGLSSYSRAAQLLDRRGRHDEAIRAMELAIAAGGAAPEHVAWCREQLALMLERRGSPAEAERLSSASARPPTGLP